MGAFDPFDPTPDMRAVNALVRLLRTRSSIVAFTGAGISTDSGIPDYRGPGGVWEQRKPPTIGDFLDNPETRRAYWQRRRHDYPILASRQPNAGHLALARLERGGRLQHVITQNVDGLHQKAGNAAGRVIELHGTAHRIRCVGCDGKFSAATIHARLDAGEMEPACERCGGILRSATVLFGEPLPRAALNDAIIAAGNCDVMLVVGSSLVVQPAAQLPLLAKRKRAMLVVINRTLTPLDALADIHVLGEAAPVLEAIASGLMDGSAGG